MHRFRAILGLLLLAACVSPAIPSEGPASLAPSDQPASQAASSTASASATPNASPEASAEPTAPVMADTLATIAIGGLSVRTEPSLAAERLGILAHPQTAFVLAGPVQADGYTWYELGSPGLVSAAECAVEFPPFQCTDWVGWAAGTTPTGDRWIVPSVPDCPPERDTTTYLSMDAVTRLACADDDDWRLVAYLAPAGGRGCFPVWLVDPMWMDPSCSLFFPQPAESEFDADESLQVFMGPALGDCAPGACPPFDDLIGSWVEIVGHFDDPAAKTCMYVLNSQFAEAPSPAPDPDLAVFTCRISFVVTELTPTTPPSP